MSMQSVIRTVTRPGLDRLLSEERHRIRGRRVGLLVNHTSVDHTLRSSVLALRDADDVVLAALFGPEHGLWGTHQDMEGVPSGVDPVSGLPVLSLYGTDEESLAPSEEALRGVDVLVFDIQDIGARYYTYVYSLLHALRVAERAGVPVIVCDRPNPLGGVVMEGNIRLPEYDSFVGRWPLPNRHGMTVGELAQMFAEGVDLPVDVIPMEGWRRSLWYDETGVPWVAPSPNMPTLDTAIIYPGLCLLEGTNLSEGRGTTRPFEVFGAPWLPAGPFAAALNERELPGARFRPCLFRPMFQKHAGDLCGGVQLHVTDRDALRSVEVGLGIIDVARRLAPDHFRWRDETYEFVDDRPAIDLLAGCAEWRSGLESGRAPAAILADAAADLAAFAERRRSYLLYE